MPARLETSLDSGNASVLGNPDKLRQVLINWITNAVDASPVGGTVLLATRLLPNEAHGCLEVRNTTVQDIAETELLLKPFYSTKSHGTGLGLAIVNGIVSAMGGEFAIEQRDHGEVIASVHIPAV